MRHELAEIVRELSRHSAARSWERVRSAADAALEGASERLLLLHDAATDNGGFKKWLASSGGNIDVKDLSPTVEQTRIVSAEMAHARVLIAAFSWVRPLDASAAAIASDVLALDGALVFTDVEGDESTAMLPAFTRGIRRLFADPSSNTGGSNVADTSLPDRCFICGDPAAATDPAIKQRLEADRSALLAWINHSRSRPTATVQNDVTTVRRLIESARTEAAATATSDATADEWQRRVTRTIADLQDIRSRLLSRLDSDAQAIRSELSTSLATTGVDLIQGLIPLIEQTRPATAVEAETEIDRHIQDGMSHWEQNARPRLQSRTGDMMRDASRMLGGVDFTLIDEAAKRLGRPAGYAEDLLRLFPDPGPGSFRPAGGGDPPSGGPAGRWPEWASVLPARLGTALATGVGVTLVGVGLAPAVMIAGVVLGNDLRRDHRRNKMRADAVRDGSLKIESLVMDQTAKISRTVDDVAADLRRKVEEAVGSVEQLLRESTTGAASTGSIAGDAEFFDRLTASLDSFSKVQS